MLVVDGMNVIGARPHTLWWRDRVGAQRQFVLELQGLDEPVLVVFDGEPVELRTPRDVEVRWASRPGRDAADDEIAALVGRYADPEELTVVTADHELASRVRSAGAQVVGPRSLLDRLAR